jgi:hypothetical protein
VGPKAGLDRCGKSGPPPGFDPRTVQPVAQSLYQLTYPAHFNVGVEGYFNFSGIHPSVSKKYLNEK